MTPSDRAFPVIGEYNTRSHRMRLQDKDYRTFVLPALSRMEYCHRNTLLRSTPSLTVYHCLNLPEQDLFWVPR